MLLAILVVAAFCGGIHFERELQRRRDEALLAEVEAAAEAVTRSGMVRFDPLFDEEPFRDAESMADIVTQTESATP